MSDDDYSESKYRQLMENFVELMDSINMEVPKEIKPFYDLYKAQMENPNIDHSIFEDPMILNGLEPFGNNCTFLIESRKVENIDIHLVFFAPAIKIREFTNKMLYSEYRIYARHDEKTKDDTDKMNNLILATLHDGGNSTDLLTRICERNMVVFRDDILEWFSKFLVSHDDNIVQYQISLPLGTKKAKAIDELDEAASKFEKILYKIRSGAGVL